MSECTEAKLREPTVAEIDRAAWAWRNARQRETDASDQAYFKNYWRSLPGLRGYVETIVQAADDVTATLEQEVDCPRCHEACGWCSDYRFMHGKLNLPGTRRPCTMKEVEPEGDDCPICRGTLRATARTVFTASFTLPNSLGPEC